MKFILKALLAVGFYSVTFAQSYYNIGQGSQLKDASGRRFNRFDTVLTTASFSVQNCYNWCINAWNGPTPLRGFWIENGAVCNCAAEFDASTYATYVDTNQAVRYSYLISDPGKGSYGYQYGSGSHDLYSLTEPTTMDATLVGTGGFCLDSNGNNYDQYVFTSTAFGVDKTLHQCYDLCKLVGQEKNLPNRGFEYKATTESCSCLFDNGLMDGSATSWSEETVATLFLGTGDITQVGSTDSNLACYTYETPFTEIGRTYYVADPRGRRMDHFTKTENGPSTASLYGCYNYCIGSGLTIRSFGIDSTFSPPSCDCHVDHNALLNLPSNYATSTYTFGYGYGPQQSISMLSDPGTNGGAIYYSMAEPTTVPYIQVGTDQYCHDASGKEYDRWTFGSSDAATEGITSADQCAQLCTLVDTYSPTVTVTRGFHYYSSNKMCQCLVDDGGVEPFLPGYDFLAQGNTVSREGNGEIVTSVGGVSEGRGCYKFNAPASTSAPTTSPTRSPTTYFTKTLVGNGACGVKTVNGGIAHPWRVWNTNNDGQSEAQCDAFCQTCKFGSDRKPAIGYTFNNDNNRCLCHSDLRDVQIRDCGVTNTFVLDSSQTLIYDAKISGIRDPYENEVCQRYGAAHEPSEPYVYFGAGFCRRGGNVPDLAFDTDYYGVTSPEACGQKCGTLDPSVFTLRGFHLTKSGQPNSQQCVCYFDDVASNLTPNPPLGFSNANFGNSGSGPIDSVSATAEADCYIFSDSFAPTVSPTKSPTKLPYYSIGSGYHPRDINGVTYEYFRTIQTPHINSLDECSTYCRSNPNGVTIRAFTLNPVEGGTNNGVLPGCTCSIDNNQLDNVPQSYSDQRQQHRDGVGIVAGLQTGEWSVEWYVYESTGSFAPTGTPTAAPIFQPTASPTTRNPTVSPTNFPTRSPIESSYRLDGTIGACLDQNDVLFDYVEIRDTTSPDDDGCHHLSTYQANPDTSGYTASIQRTCESISDDHGLNLVGFQFGYDYQSFNNYCVRTPRCLFANVASPPNMAFETRVNGFSFGGGAVGIPVGRGENRTTYVDANGNERESVSNYCYSMGTKNPTSSPTISPTQAYPTWEHVGSGQCQADLNRGFNNNYYNLIVASGEQYLQDGICAEMCVDEFNNMAPNVAVNVALRGFSNKAGRSCYCYYDAVDTITTDKPAFFNANLRGYGPIGNTLLSNTALDCNRFTSLEEPLQPTQLIGKDRNCHDNDNLPFDCITTNIYALGSDAKCGNWCWENRVTGLMGYMVEAEECHCLYSDGMINQLTQLNATEPWVITSTNNGVGIPAFKDLGSPSHQDHRDCYVYEKPFYGDGVQSQVTDLGQGQCTAGGQSYDMVWYDVGVAPEMTPDEQIALCYFTAKPEIRDLFEGVIHQFADQDRIFCLFDTTAEPLSDSKFFRIPDGKFEGNTATGPPDGTNGQAGFECYAFNTNATATPTVQPTLAPSGSPTRKPTSSPSATPTGAPTGSPIPHPTASPSTTPTGAPTQSPNNIPTASPIPNPTGTPTISPSANPTVSPSAKPTSSPIPATMTLVGIGHCLDENGQKYDKVFFNREGKDTLEGCYGLCTSWASNHSIPNVLRGFNYNPSGTSSCQCNFDDHLDVSSVVRESYDSRQTSNTGTGPIYSSGGSFTGETFTCVAIGAGPPTLTPTQSPIRFVDASYLVASNQTCRDNQGNPYDYVLLDGTSGCEHLCRNLSDTVTTGLTKLVGYEQSIPAGGFCACLFEDGLPISTGSTYESHPGFLNSVVDRTGLGTISFGGSLIQGDVDCYTFGTEAPTMAPTAAPTREFPKYTEIGTGECTDEIGNLYDTFSFNGTDCSNECYDRELSYGAACVYIGYTHDAENDICHCHCSDNMISGLITESTIDSRNGTGPIVGTSGEANKTCYESINPDAAFENFHVGHGECYDYQNKTYDKIVYPMSLMDGWWKCGDYCADYRVNDFLVGYEILLGSNCSCLYSDGKLDGVSIDGANVVREHTGFGAIKSNAHEHHSHNHTGFHNHCYKYSNNFHFTPVDRGVGQCVNSAGDMYDRFFYDMDEPVDNINDAMEFCMAASPPDILSIFRGTTTFENKPNRIYCLYDNGLGQKLKPDMNPEATGIYRGHFASGSVTGANGAKKLHCYSAELIPTPPPTTAAPTASPFTPPASTLVSSNGKCADVFSRLYVEHTLENNLNRDTCARDCHNKASAVGYQYELNACVCLTADGPNGSGRGKVFGVNGTDTSSCYSFDSPRLPSRPFTNIGQGQCLGSDGKAYDKVEFTSVPESYCSDFCCAQYELFDHLVGTEFTLDNKCRCLYQTPGLDEHDLDMGVDIDLDESTTVISTSDGTAGLTCFDKGTASPTGSPTRRPTDAPSPSPTKSPTVTPDAFFLGRGFPVDQNGNRYDGVTFIIQNITFQKCYNACLQYDRSKYPYLPKGMGFSDYGTGIGGCGCFFDDGLLPGPEEYTNIVSYNESHVGTGDVGSLISATEYGEITGQPITEDTVPEVYLYKVTTPFPTQSPVPPTFSPTASPTSTAFTFIGIGSGIDGQNQFDSVTYYGTWDESTCYDKCTDYDTTVILNSPVGMLIGTTPTDNGCECLWESPIPDRVLFPGSDEYNTIGLASGKLVFLQRDEVKKFLYTFGEATSPDAWPYAKQGDGLCLDQNNEYYDRVVYDGVRDENSCASTCQNNRVGDNLVAFNYESTVYKRCICYYKDSIPPESEFPSNDAYDDKFKGNTTVGGTLSAGLEYYDCYAYNATNSPTVSPTISPSKSPTTTPTVSPTTKSPTISPTTKSPTVSPTESISFNFVGFGDCRDSQSRLYDHSIIDLPDGNLKTCHGHFTSRASAVGFMVRTDTKKCLILYSNPMPAFGNLGPNVIGFDSSHDGVGAVSTADGASLSKRCYTATAPTPAPTSPPTDDSSSDSFVAVIVTYSVVGFLVIVALGGVVLVRNKGSIMEAAKYNPITDF